MLHFLYIIPQKILLRMYKYPDNNNNPEIIKETIKIIKLEIYKSFSKLCKSLKTLLLLILCSVVLLFE